MITSFTLAHSLTLSLAALNIVTAPPRIIEPAIALSIVYVGADNLLARGGRVGVEIGQLMVVASSLTALRTRSELSGRRIAFAG